MKIEISHQEFRTLAKMLDIAHSVTETLGESSERHLLIHEKFSKLKDKIYRAGLADDIPGVEACESDNGEHVVLDSESGEFTARLLALYADSEFWDELASRLAHRDFETRLSEAAKNSAPDVSYTDIEILLEEYRNEFEKRGLERVTIAL